MSAGFNRGEQGVFSLFFLLVKFAKDMGKVENLFLKGKECGFYAICTIKNL